MAARASALPLPQQPLCSQQPQPSTVPGALSAPRAPHGPPQNSALAAFGAACSRAGTYSRGATKTRLTARRQTGARLILRPSVPLADSLRLESCCLSVRAQRPPARQLAGSSAFAQQSAASCSPPFGAAQRRGGRAGGSAYICHRPQQPHSAARHHRAWFVSSLQGSQMGWLHVGHTARSGRAGESNATASLALLRENKELLGSAARALHGCEPRTAPSPQQPPALKHLQHALAPLPSQGKEPAENVVCFAQSRPSPGPHTETRRGRRGPQKRRSQKGKQTGRSRPPPALHNAAVLGAGRAAGMTLSPSRTKPGPGRDGSTVAVTC